MAQTDQPSETAGATDPDSSTSAEIAASQSKSGIALRSLAPDHKEKEHAVYAQHLEAAITDPRNRNIALTGRYGSGKSSILDYFLARAETPQSEAADDAEKPNGGKRRKSRTRDSQHKTLRISISTLGPKEDDPDITNRIQKELVKQLLYRVEPGKVLRSRFARRPEPNRARLIGEPLGVSAGLVGILWLFGIRPDLTSPGSGGFVWGAASLLSLFFLVAVGAWAVRDYLGNRLISHFSGFGATIEFDKPTDSFFDKYLDEIIEFFDATGTDLVVFEDLDRFEDPRIFESLRGLNTLINSSAGRRDRDQPLRFIYAIKDSVFEKLGEEVAGERAGAVPAPDSSAEKEGPSESSNPSPKQCRGKKLDPTQPAVERANRTKFFELVIPVVPFLSHSNARDLLSETLEGLGLPEDTQVSRKLVDLVARHTTDMRLMINICNEFVVFGQKLLWGERLAPGVEADEVFAVVAYKNFHPADFEALPHRRSALDVLERRRREIVNKSVEKLQQDKADVPDQDRLRREQETTAQALGERLSIWSSIMGKTVTQITVGGRAYTGEDFRTPEFWRQVASKGIMRLGLHSSQRSPSPRPDLNKDQLQKLLPEAVDARRWQKSDVDLARQRELLDEEIAQLRGADFEFLATRDDYTAGNVSFAETLEAELDSDLARELVRRGFLTRYYAEYSSVFYGNFIGVEVANFFRNCVWPNEMDVQFRLKSHVSLKNVIEQAPEEFTSSHSVFNIDVVNYLLENRPLEAAEVAAFIVSDTTGKGMTFLDAFLKDASSQKAKLISHLTRLPWPGVFEHIAHPDSVLQQTVRTELLDAALSAASRVEDYDLNDQMSDQLHQHYQSLDSFTSSSKEARSDLTYAFARRVNLNIPSLTPLSKRMRRHFIEDGAYELNSENLRCSVSLQPGDPIALDAMCEDNYVWKRCTEDISRYLDVVKADDHSTYAVLSAGVLGEVIQERREAWTDDQLTAVLELSSPDAAISEITTVHEEAWPAILHTRRMKPTARNVLVCAGETRVGTNLAAFLEDSGQLQDVDQLENDDKLQLALYMLNSPSMNPPTAVDLVQQLGISRIEVSYLEPRADDLLAELLQAQLVPDARATFEHFIITAGWPAVAQAFSVSKKAPEFLDPDLVSHVVADLLEDPAILDGLKEAVVGQLDDYASDDDDRALRAAGAFARTARIELPMEQIKRIAGASPGSQDVLWQLDKKKNSLSVDQLIGVLTELGEEYRGFGAAAGHKFSVPTSSEMHRLLGHLEKAGRVESAPAKRGRRPVRIVA